MDSETVTIVAALVGALVGGFIGLAGVFGIELFKDFLSRRKLRGAYAAEIRVLLNLSRDVRLVENLENTIEMMKTTLAPQGVSNSIAENYRMVFAATAAQLGMLGVAQSERIVNFYYKFGSIIEDLRASNAVHEGRPPAYLCNFDDCLKFHVLLLEKVLDAQEIACNLINELERKVLPQL
jgi:hypothetical protein